MISAVGPEHGVVPCSAPCGEAATAEQCEPLPHVHLTITAHRAGLGSLGCMLELRLLCLPAIPQVLQTPRVCLTEFHLQLGLFVL